jgi:hypothetical protein
MEDDANDDELTPVGLRAPTLNQRPPSPRSHWAPDLRIRLNVYRDSPALTPAQQEAALLDGKQPQPLYVLDMQRTGGDPVEFMRLAATTIALLKTKR